MKETRTSTGDVGLLPRIREMGAFKSLEESKRNAMNDDEKVATVVIVVIKNFNLSAWET